MRKVRIPKWQYILLLFLLIIFISCSNNSRPTPNKPTNVESKPIVINKINFILENSGSMEGYFNGAKFKKEITDLIAELEKIKLDSNNIDINNISFMTMNDEKSLKEFSGSSYDFCNKINTHGIGVGKTSPIDNLVKSIVDSIDTKTINILVSDFVIDKKNKDDLATLQSSFNIIFNKAKQKNLGVLIYRMTSDFTGKYYPALGSPQIVKDLTRPYFIWFVGSNELIDSLRRQLMKSDVFKPENEIVFGISMKPSKIDVMRLSNRIGTWRFRDGEFHDANLKKGKLKFSLGVDFSELPSYLSDSTYLSKNLSITSSTLNILPYNIYPKDIFIKKLHRKEKEYSTEYTHLIEVNISAINSDRNKINISLTKGSQEWLSNFCTNDDSSIENGNNLKTFGLKQIIEGISNAYGDLGGTSNYFEVNYLFTK